MTEDRDPLLQSLFAEAEQDLPGETFTLDVMARVEAYKKRTRLLWIGAGLTVMVYLWLLAPFLQQGSQLLTHAFSYSLISVETPLIAELLSPINNIACMVVIGIVGFGILFRKIFS